MTAAPAVAAGAGAAAGSAPARGYVGLVTRAIAFALDAALINVGGILAAAVVALTFSVLTVPQDTRTAIAAIGAAAYLLWTVGYFVTFWTTTGQTPGSRVMRIRVCAAPDGPLRPGRAVVRFVGLILAAIPLFAGFLLILVDDRHRGLHDMLARTVVVEAGDEPAERPRRGRSPPPSP